MEVEHCIRRDAEEIRNILHRIKPTVEKSWPNDMNNIEVPQQNAERDAPARQRTQGNIDYSLKGVRLRYLSREAQENRMEKLNATCSDLSARIIHSDVSFQESSTFLNDEEHTKAQMSTLGQKMKNLGS